MAFPNRKTDYERKEILQAVIIGDSFDNQFDPITREIPKILLPLVNTPIIYYNLDWLHRCGVEDVILYCRSTPFSAKIKKHCTTVLDRRQWKTMSVRVIASDEIRSTGDALRDLYSRSLIVGDFILMRGDSVCSVDLRQMMEVHKANKQYDSKTAVTCLFMPEEMSFDSDLEDLESMAEDSHGSSDMDSMSSLSSLRVSLISTVRGKILAYGRHRKGTPCPLPTSFFSDLQNNGHQNIVMLTQLPDPNISICSGDVPGLFADNFDWISTDSLVKGLVQPEDLNECSVYQYIIREGYAATIATWNDYERVSLAITQRLLYPLCPEVSLTSGRHRYKHCASTNRYWTASGSFGEFGYIKGVQHGDVASIRMHQHGIGSRVVCGEAIEVSPTARARNCVFGNLCKIGDQADLERAYVGDNCTIESGCVVRQSYLGNNVTLLHDTVLEPGCVVASGVTLGPNQTITRATLVATKALLETLDEFEQDGDPVPISSNGFIFPRLSGHAVDNTDDLSDDDSDCDMVSSTRAATARTTSTSAAATAAVSETGFTTNVDGVLLPVWALKKDDFIFVEDEDDCSSCEGERRGGYGDVVDGAGDDEEELDEDEQRELQCMHEVMDSLVTGIRQKTELSKLVLEVNGSRYAYNISLETMQQLVLKCVLRCYKEAKNGGGGAEWPDWGTARQGLRRYSDLLVKYHKETVHILDTIERMVCRDANVLSCAVNLLCELSQELELIEDADVLIWFKKGGAKRDDPPSSEGFFKLQEKVSTFLTWLENAEEESSEEEEN